MCGWSPCSQSSTSWKAWFGYQWTRSQYHIPFRITGDSYGLNGSCKCWWSLIISLLFSVILDSKCSTLSKLFNQIMKHGTSLQAIILFLILINMSLQLIFEENVLKRFWSIFFIVIILTRIFFWYWMNDSDFSNKEVILDFFFSCLQLVYQYTTSYIATLDIDWPSIKQMVREQHQDRSLNVVITFC